VRECTSFVAFQVHPDTSTPRRITRRLNKGIANLLKRYGTNVGLTVEKAL
jgi:hypothetical protein